MENDPDFVSEMQTVTGNAICQMLLGPNTCERALELGLKRKIRAHVAMISQLASALHSASRRGEDSPLRPSETSQCFLVDYLFSD